MVLVDNVLATYFSERVKIIVQNNKSILMTKIFRKMTIFGCLLFTGFCFWKVGAGLIGGADALVLPSAQATLSPSLSPPRVVTTPIQEMRPGMRVVGRNPLRIETEATIDPTPAGWRLVSVRMLKPDGTYFEAELLRPLSWISRHRAKPGAVIELTMPELHVVGAAEVLSISACPPIDPGDGPVVLSTFKNVAKNVLDIYVEGEAEPIGVTAGHPIWSEDRQAFIHSDQLQPGERLRSAVGKTVRITSIEIRAGPETVYGLEVAGEHVYQITNAGLLVHNACGKGGGNLNAPDVSAYKVRKNSEGLTVRAEGVVSGPHPGRKKGYRPEPVGGRAKGHHRGHLVPENMVDNPSLVNVQSNIISEAAKSNLSPKRTFEKLAGRIAAENPNSIVKTIHFPKRRPGETVPFLVTHYITVDGKMVHGVSIPNK